jgi:inward rectifier potassium channel
MGSTRVFGASGGVEVVGLRRRPGRDLYHWLVTGPWPRLLAFFAVAWAATWLAFGGLRLAAAGRLPALALDVLAGVEGFVRWAEVVVASGIVLAKFSLVRARVLFSDVAVVGPHEGGVALAFRMANERASHIVDAKVSAMLVRNELHDGEIVRRAHDLALARGGSALFSHAWTAVHPIDRESPLHGETAGSLEGSEAEIIVNLSGYDEALVKTLYARHVYPAGRIIWNARFREIVRMRDDGRRVIDYRKFHKTMPAEETPTPAERPAPRRAR